MIKSFFIYLTITLVITYTHTFNALAQVDGRNFGGAYDSGGGVGFSFVGLIYGLLTIAIFLGIVLFLTNVFENLKEDSDRKKRWKQEENKNTVKFIVKNDVIYKGLLTNFKENGKVNLLTTLETYMRVSSKMEN